MKVSLLAVAASAALSTFVVSAVAVAAPEKVEKGSKDTGGGAGAGGGGGGGGASGGGTEAVASPRDQPAAEGMVESRDPAKKFWEVGVSAEYHRLFVQNDLEGAAANKNLMVYAAYAEVDPTPRDKIRLRAFVFERFLADPNETGVRSDDVILQYTHVQKLPYDLTLKPGAWVTFPTSFSSQKASSITSPRVYVGLDKALGNWVHIEPRASGDYYIVRYGTVDGGSTPNAQFRTGLGANVEVQMPFHPALSIGADGGVAYYWYYKARASQAGTNNPSFPGTVQDGTFKDQPVQQTYGFEAYARYDLSKYRPQKATDFHWDFTLSLANGDPAIGTNSVIHDGSVAVYWGFRTTAEVYGVLAARY
jgi:hypothetical protein